MYVNNSLILNKKNNKVPLPKYEAFLHESQQEIWTSPEQAFPFPQGPLSVRESHIVTGRSVRGIHVPFQTLSDLLLWLREAGIVQ